MEILELHAVVEHLTNVTSDDSILTIEIRDDKN